MSEERLQKILARAGVASRRKIEELIREARVTINGRLAEIGDKADLERDAVKVDGKRIQPARGQHRYLLLNKPKGVMSTAADPEGRPTVMDLVPPPLRKALVPVGRLDYLTEGLLLLTDDGELAQQVAHPRYGCTKTYEVKVKGRPSEAEVAKLEAGVVLDGRRTSPSRITPRPVPRRHEDMENSWWYVELSEGRTRQIREMFHRIGHPVQKLRRIAIGPVKDPDLPVGGLRDLTEREVEALRRSARKAEAKPGGKKRAAAAGGEEAGGRAKPARRTAAGAAKSGAGRGAPRGSRPDGAAERPIPAEKPVWDAGWDFDDDEVPPPLAAAPRPGETRGRGAGPSQRPPAARGRRAGGRSERGPGRSTGGRGRERAEAPAPARQRGGGTGRGASSAGAGRRGGPAGGRSGGQGGAKPRGAAGPGGRGGAGRPGGRPGSRPGGSRPGGGRSGGGPRRGRG